MASLCSSIVYGIIRSLYIIVIDIIIYNKYCWSDNQMGEKL